IKFIVFFIMLVMVMFTMLIKFIVFFIMLVMFMIMMLVMVLVLAMLIISRMCQSRLIIGIYISKLTPLIPSRHPSQKLSIIINNIYIHVNRKVLERCLCLRLYCY
ncbi:hypothetical protein TraAM80_09725, partial [Trypanosoma rangeli]